MKHGNFIKARSSGYQNATIFTNLQTQFYGTFTDALGRTASVQGRYF